MHPHSKLIAKLGGTTHVGNLFGFTAQRIQNWRHNGIPWKYRFAFKRLCEEKEINVPKDFMG